MDPALLELMLAVAKLTNQPFLCAFSTYRQVPEHCFPAAIEDILTVVLDLLERFSHVHIVGLSAGLNLAAVAAMEMHRQCPGRIRSATLLCPLLNPAANSLSYHMNRNVWFVPPEWLRWCWRMYLKLPPSTDKQSDMDHGSNATTWEASTWRTSSLARFIHPTIDLPERLDDHNTTHFIVTTNEADPLCEEGKHLAVEKEKRGANVRYLQHSGPHWLGTAVDTTGQMAELVEEMTRVLFPLCS
jgi:acetyl esterase/lipase